MSVGNTARSARTSCPRTRSTLATRTCGGEVFVRPRRRGGRLLSGEEQLIEALPEMAEAAHASELKSGFEQHLDQTRGHAEKVRGILDRLGAPTKAKTCPAMEGLIAAGKTRIELDAPDNGRFEKRLRACFVLEIPRPLRWLGWG